LNLCRKHSLPPETSAKRSHLTRKLIL
jgi:hypothetical protein